MRVVIEIDGGSRGNPGPAAAALVVRDGDDGRVLDEKSWYLGETTNNVAEWTALENAVRYLAAVAAKHGPVQALIRADSELVVRQFNGAYRIKQPHLQEIALGIRDFLQRHPEVSVRLVHVPREENKRADAGVNRELDRFQKNSKVKKGVRHFS
ncbi:MAG: ribonuclease HI family protein [Thermoanaerobacterales bacterium]|nr:ribonuclease HI family protein [Thermoanaerobacterales bacterium]